jgi:hypothetical protein
VPRQQLLFLLLGVCLAGVMASVGVIIVQDALAPDNRRVLVEELGALATKAQEYRSRPMLQDGGEGTFLGLTPTPFGIRLLTQDPSGVHGDFFIRTAGTVTSVELMAVGVERGYDPRYPVRITMQVFADSVRVRMLN